MRPAPDAVQRIRRRRTSAWLATTRAEDVLYRNDIGAKVRAIVQDNASTPCQRASCEAGLAKLPNFLKLKAVR